MDTDERCFDCSTCRYRDLHFPNMDDFEISMQEFYVTVKITKKNNKKAYISAATLI